MGRDVSAFACRIVRTTFQSTRPSWGATSALYASFPPPSPFQSTRPSWGATIVEALFGASSPISIHAPLVGRDQTDLRGVIRETISIHAPLVGRDARRSEPHSSSVHFNPRAPRGARPHAAFMVMQDTLFQSTRPSWGATESFGRLGHVGGISIHAPLVGRDDGTGAAVAAGLPFQSTRPSWGATKSDVVQGRRQCISIHAPLVGRDRMRPLWLCKIRYFNPRAPRGARRGGPAVVHDRGAISIHAPLVGRD